MKEKEVILIVGDDVSTIGTLEESLRKFGYDCFVALSSAQGIQKAFECTPDLIICVPEKECFKSFEFFNIIKESSHTFDIPFIVISDSISMEDSLFALELGVDLVLDKLPKNRNLQQVIEARIKTHRRLKRESERIFLKSFDQVSYPIVIYDTDFNIVNANNSFYSIFNKDGSGFIWEVVGIDKDAFQHLSYKIFANSESREELNLRIKKNGSYEEYNLVLSSLNTLFAKRSALIVFQKVNSYDLVENIDISNSLDAKESLIDRNLFLMGQKSAPDPVSYSDGGITKPNEMNFTKRQLEVLELSILGLPMKQIADKLCISEKTVEKYRSNLMEKTGSKNIIELVLFAIKNKYVQV
ncbi:LuxR C-terminal-related transcriptional regulator [uncultured Acetobacteroides sp.]|uniref:LuxR C-terminal-related transcriptional regulator n=1 Tax=uncultured Acetobacteroides sp. TaxID=1760811 RepID=UPI0029F4C550|nr:LuxR C-terminal-related transcriptional regulator [uncultured Acetobacteroides sp.]